MTFKVNWEKSETRIQLPDDLIKQMLKTFYSENDIKDFSIISGGCANINILVQLNNSENPAILRIYLRDSSSAFKEQSISAILKGKLPVPQFYHIGEIKGYTFAITEYLPGISLRDLLIKNNYYSSIDKIMEKVGQALGTISSIKFNKNGFFNKNFEITDNITNNELVDSCISTLKDEKIQAVFSKRKLNKIETFIRTYESFLPNDSEKNLVHADFDPANILVEEKDGEIKISAILDWEFSFSGSTIWDISNMLRYAHQCPQEYQFSFLEGLLSTGYKLPISWKKIVDLLNIFSLIDCLKRSNFNNKLNQTEDIKKLIEHILIKEEIKKEKK